MKNVARCREVPKMRPENWPLDLAMEGCCDLDRSCFGAVEVGWVRMGEVDAEV